MGFSVLKFGGSSVADATNMSRVLDIVGGALDGGRVVLVSLSRHLFGYDWLN